jgi:putative transcriptional regulator
MLYIAAHTLYSVLTSMKETIKNEVYEWRLKKGVTQEGLAEKMRVSRQTIIAIEKGNYTPSVLLALKLAGFFSMPVEKLFKISNEK